MPKVSSVRISTKKKCDRSKKITEILNSETRLSPFWANTPTSNWNEESYLISAGFQDLKATQQSLFTQYNLIKKVISGFPCPEYELVQENLMEERVQLGNKPDFHLKESPQLMCGEIKSDNDIKTDHFNTGKLLQELSDELEFVFEKRVGIYVMRVLGNGVYLGVEVDNFEIPTILQNIDKLVDGIQKVLISKVRFEESVKRVEITKKAIYPSSPELVSNLPMSNLPGKIIRATNHSPKRV
ncbi:12359_t:CDS:2 [Funneliformis geosporum]|uniref:19409_t:CDS:1 n=1 Tax=Funneliformis geosporum TaxID=1117311 RepID=A0A9W4T253_9GLOM|nr:19409_t:CDS:2 [Funneliformis geosporum]CAI2190383.1 12359_t:CDS:2 [Funneliformis geosporum]